MYKNYQKLFFTFFFILVASSVATAQNLKSEIILPEQLTPEEEYHHIFKIINTDFKRGMRFSINATVGLNISSEDFLLNKIVVLEGINWYKKPRLEPPFVPAENKTYLVCAGIINSSVNDTNQSDDKTCKIVTTVNGTGIVENDPAISIQILNQNQTLAEGETIFFKHIVNCSSDSSITYWIEDIYGNIAKARRNTTSLSKKQWKTKAYSQVSPYFIRSILFCGKTNASAKAAFFVLKIEESGKEEEQENVENGNAPKEKKCKACKTTDDHCINKIDIKIPSKANFGKEINIEVKVNRCGGRKRKIELKILDRYNFTIAKTKFNINSVGKFTFTMPFNIPQCSYCYNGNYTIIAEGLNTNTSHKIFLEQQVQRLVSANTHNSKQRELILRAKKAQLPPKEIYSKQTKHVFPYLFLTLVGLLLFVARRR